MNIHLTPLFAAAIAAVILSGCAVREVPVIWEEETVEPAPALTFATFDFAVEGATKAALVGNAGEKDSIKSFRLMIYAHKAGNLGLCEVDTTIMASDSASATVLVTVGAKRIFVVANEHDKTWRFANQKGQSLLQLLDSRTMAGGGKLFLHEIDFGTPDFGASLYLLPLVSLDYTDMALPYMVFSNAQSDSSSLRNLHPDISAEASQDEQADSTTNRFTIELQRTLAKVTMFNSSGSEIASAESIAGTFGEIYWGVRNQSRAVALFRSTDVNGKLQPPFYNITEGYNPEWTDLYKVFWWKNDLTGREINIPVADVDSLPEYYYVPENVYDEERNSTYIAVKAEFTPADMTVIRSATFDVAIGKLDVTLMSYRVPMTFHRLNPEAYKAALDRRLIDETIFNAPSSSPGSLFSNIYDAKRVSYILEHKNSDAGYLSNYEPEILKIDTYENGVCYYRFDMSDNAEGGIIRNRQYRGTITEFTDLGAPRLTDLDNIYAAPKVAPKAVVSLRILPWETVEENAGTSADSSRIMRHSPRINRYAR
ncbi:MAG: hypothetical protein LBH04_10045 [Tannerellaceae bacterium]|jgi:hypothetical protein|nr:hypothetical protein [Tannerellaceae bacterium]